jgi:hypothetical protein
MVARAVVMLSHFSSSLDNTALDGPGLSPHMLLGIGVVVGWRLGFAEVVALVEGLVLGVVGLLVVVVTAQGWWG